MSELKKDIRLIKVFEELAKSGKCGAVAQLWIDENHKKIGLSEQDVYGLFELAGVKGCVFKVIEHLKEPAYAETEFIYDAKRFFELISFALTSVHSTEERVEIICQCHKYCFGAWLDESDSVSRDELQKIKEQLISYLGQITLLCANELDDVILNRVICHIFLISEKLAYD